MLALTIIGMLGTAAGATVALVPRAHAASTCDTVVADELDFAVVMQLIVFCQEELALSEAQNARVEALSLRFLEEALHHQTRREIAERELAALVRPNPDDPARALDLPAAEAKIREIARIASDEEISALRTVEATKAVLTPLQRVKLATLAESRGARRPRLDL